jgi:hypothetical protein
MMPGRTHAGKGVSNGTRTDLTYRLDGGACAFKRRFKAQLIYEGIFGDLLFSGSLGLTTGLFQFLYIALVMRTQNIFQRGRSARQYSHDTRQPHRKHAVFDRINAFGRLGRIRPLLIAVTQVVRKKSGGQKRLPFFSPGVSLTYCRVLRALGKIKARLDFRQKRA